jgi:hypothetical protein
VTAGVAGVGLTVEKDKVAFTGLAVLESAAEVVAARLMQEA